MMIQSSERLDDLSSDGPLRSRLRQAAERLHYPFSLCNLLLAIERPEEADELIAGLLRKESLSDDEYAGIISDAAIFYKELDQDIAGLPGHEMALERALPLLLSRSDMPDLLILPMLLTRFPQTLRPAPETLLARMSLDSANTTRGLGVRCSLVAAYCVSTPSEFERYVTRQSSCRRELLSAFFVLFIYSYLVFAIPALGGRSIESSLRLMIAGTPLFREEWRLLLSSSNSPLHTHLPWARKHLSDLIDESLIATRSSLFDNLYFGELFENRANSQEPDNRAGNHFG